MKMAKKVCEDWASLLLNEETKITVDDTQSQEYIDGLFKNISFWQSANELVEKAFYSGTGALVLRVNDIQVQGENAVANTNTSISIEYINALNIIPISFSNGVITEAAFVSEIMRKGQKYIYLEIHTRTDTGQQVENKMFKVNEDGAIEPQSLDAGVAETINIKIDVPLFAMIRPNIVNSIDGNNGLGVSIFNDAIDNLQGVDLAFNNFNRDFKLGGKKVFYAQSLVRREAYQGTDEDGNPTTKYRTITPDDVMQQLFIQVGDDTDIQSKSMIQEYNPSLRVDENTAGIQAELDYLSFKLGFGAKHYQFNSGSIVTATQYHGDKQELVQHASKHMIIIDRALTSITKAILSIAKTLQGANVNQDAEITIQFEDGFIIDKEAEKTNDKMDVREGLMLKEEYRVKWYGETIEEAREVLSRNTTVNMFGGVE